MRKFIALGLLAALAIGLFAGCSRRLNNVSDTARDLGEKVIVITDDFLDENITAATARDKIDALNYREKIPVDTDNRDDSFVRFRILAIGSRLLLGAEGEDLTAIIELRNELAVGLGLDRR